MSSTRLSVLRVLVREIENAPRRDLDRLERELYACSDESWTAKRHKALEQRNPRHLAEQNGYSPVHWKALTRSLKDFLQTQHTEHHQWKSDTTIEEVLPGEASKTYELSWDHTSAHHTRFDRCFKLASDAARARQELWPWINRILRSRWRRVSILPPLLMRFPTPEGNASDTTNSQTKHTPVQSDSALKAQHYCLALKWQGDSEDTQGFVAVKASEVQQCHLLLWVSTQGYVIPLVNLGAQWTDTQQAYLQDWFRQVTLPPRALDAAQSWKHVLNKRPSHMLNT